MIKVLNKRRVNQQDEEQYELIYIGRPSVLGNPFQKGHGDTDRKLTSAEPTLVMCCILHSMMLI